MISAIGQVISSLITVMVCLVVFPLYSPWALILSKIFFPRSVTKENGYRPRLASNTAAIQTQSDASVSQASMHLQIHSPQLTSLPGSPKSMSREGTPSPPPAFWLRHPNRVGKAASIVEEDDVTRVCAAPLRTSLALTSCLCRY